MTKALLPLYFALLLMTMPFSMAQSLADRLKNLDQYIEAARNQWQVPGLAVAIVKDGKTLMTKGYGVRSLETLEPVDTHTLFAICSTTKAMTSAAMAMLVDAGKIAWNDPVIEHLPEFQLHDPYITRSLRIRDLFTHNSGVGNADLLWYLWHHDPHDILYRMRHLPAKYPLRGGYTYQNIMYAAAGEIVARISGTTWEDFVSKNIFDPLEMRQTFANQQRSLPYANRSQPHIRYNDSIHVIPDGSADLIAPAGAVWSTISDMTKWMHFVLDTTRLEGERLISEENYLEWFKPQSIVSEEGFYPTQKLTNPTWKTYGLGWFQHDYYGKTLHFHTGSLQGTVAIIGLVPEEKLGVYVFGNLDHAEVRHAIMYKTIDVLCGHKEDRDWSTEIKELYASRLSRDKVKYQTIEVSDLNIFLGTFEDPFLGQLHISKTDDHLEMTFGSDQTAILRPTHPNVFLASFPKHPWRSETRVHFEDIGSGVEALLFSGRRFSKIETDERK